MAYNNKYKKKKSKFVIWLYSILLSFVAFVTFGSFIYVGNWLLFDKWQLPVWAYFVIGLVGLFILSSVGAYNYITNKLR